MRVALVCPYSLDRAGGVQDQVFRLHRWLTDLGHESWIIGPSDAEGTPAEGVISMGGSISVRANRSTAPVAIDPRVLRRVRVAVDGADVVHIHEPFLPMVSLAATRIATLPSVGTFHADAAPWVRRALRIGGPFARLLAGRLDVATAVSPIARSVIGAIDDVRIIPNGIDVGTYGGDAVERSRVVFVGRDDPRKGLDVLLDAWSTVRASHPEATLDVVGARRDGSIAGVTFHGWVDDETKRYLLGRAAIAVAPNLGGESFGIVVAEEMASTCAVVASALPAFTQVLGDAGELVRPGDAVGLAERIVALLADDERRSLLGAAAAERVKRFDGPVVASAYLTAYQDAMAIHGE